MKTARDHYEEDLHRRMSAEQFRHQAECYRQQEAIIDEARMEAALSGVAATLVFAVLIGGIFLVATLLGN